MTTALPIVSFPPERIRRLAEPVQPFVLIQPDNWKMCVPEIPDTYDSANPSSGIQPGTSCNDHLPPPGGASCANEAISETGHPNSESWPPDSKLESRIKLA